MLNVWTQAEEMQGTATNGDPNERKKEGNENKYFCSKTQIPISLINVTSSKNLCKPLQVKHFYYLNWIVPQWCEMQNIRDKLISKQQMNLKRKQK